MHDAHLNLAGELALAWGNEQFEPPNGYVQYLARNHDAGWAEYDESPPLAADGFPPHMPDIPSATLSGIHRRSIERNYRFHPYAGILGCLHHRGFFNGRFGKSDYLVHHMDDAAETAPAVVPPFIHQIEAEQARWTEELRQQGGFDALLDEDTLMRHYTLLQVFDTMSLYFCINEPGEFQAQSFPNVPASDTNSVTIEIAPTGETTFSVAPYPFADSPLGLVLDFKRLPRVTGAPSADMLKIATEQRAYELTPR